MVTDRHYSMDIGTRYSMPPVSAVGRLPLATLEACDPGRRIDARLLTFRARAADQAHAAFTPGTAWPVLGTSANAAQGGLTPPSEGRRRRANKPPSLAQHRLCEDRLHQSPFSVRDARLSHESPVLSVCRGKLAYAAELPRGSP